MNIMLLIWCTCFFLYEISTRTSVELLCARSLLFLSSVRPKRNLNRGIATSREALGRVSGQSLHGGRVPPLQQAVEHVLRVHYSHR